MPRWTSSASSPRRNSRYLLRRSTRVDGPVRDGRRQLCREPASANAGRIRAVRRSGARPTCGSRPRRVVSTSGSSGIGYAACAPWPDSANRRVWRAREYNLTSAGRRAPPGSSATARGVVLHGIQRPSRCAFTVAVSSLPRWPWRRSPVPRQRSAPQKAAAPTGEGSAAASPREELTADLMYRLLVGDVALQRGDVNVAARAYFEAARDTREPGAGAARDRDRARDATARDRAGGGAPVGRARA